MKKENKKKKQERSNKRIQKLETQVKKLTLDWTSNDFHWGKIRSKSNKKELEILQKLKNRPSKNLMKKS